MATLSVLGSLMSQLGSTAMPQYDPLEVARQQNFVQGGRVNNQTALLQLQDLQRQQQTAERVREMYRQNPTLLFGGGDPLAQSPLASLGAGGAMTQQAFGPGGAGATQQVPGYPDMSRFAGVSPQSGGPMPPGMAQQFMPTVTPAQSTLGALSQPQGNPLVALARTDPDAAQAIYQRQQQMQEWRQQQDLNRLTMGLKVAEFVANEFQGVTDQASLEQARERVARVHPQAAAALPQWYTKEGVAAVVQRGMTAKDNAEARLKNAQAQTFETAQTLLPETLKALQGVTQPGTEPTPPPPQASTPATTATLSPAFRTKTGDIETRLGMQSGDLLRIMDFETGGTFNPAEPNKAGSGATGLIQFMPDTAKALGTTTEALAKMSPEQQLDYVEKYLSQYKGKIGNLQDAYMAVLYPEAIGKSGNYKLFTQDTKAYEQNAALDTDKKGYVTVSDAVRAVQRGRGLRAASTTPAAPSANPEVQRLSQGIAGVQQLINTYSLMPGMNEYADNLRQNVLDPMVKQRDRLEDRAIAERNRLEPSPARIAEQEAGRALAPIERTMAESLSTNKSIYNSIGKMESVMREGSPDLPADFVSLVAEDAPGIREALERDDPKLTGMLQQWYTKLSAASKNDPRVNRFLSALAQIRDLVIFERSGGSVTGNELTRATGAFLGSLPNVNQAFSLFMQNLANVKETVTDRLVTMGASVRPLSGGKAVYGGLPKEVRERIEAYERGEEYTPKRTAQAAPVQGRGRVAGPVRQVD
jgi:hypothetical protein